MGKRLYPPLTPSEVGAILKSLKFTFKNKEGSHEQWECPADAKHPRAIVTVDTGERDFDDFLMKSMVRQSKRTRAEFYGATKRTAKKASVPILKEAEAE